jgi:hypothetical protein
MHTSVRSDDAGIQNDMLDDDDDDLESNISEPDEPEEEPDSQTDPVILDLVDMISRFPPGGGQAGDAELCDTSTTVSDVTDIERDVIDENAEISDKNELFPDADTTWTLGTHFP